MSGIPVYLDGELLGHFEMTFRGELSGDDSEIGRGVSRRNVWVELTTPPAT